MARETLNVRVEKVTKSYIEEKSKELGVSQNSFVNIAITQYEKASKILLIMSELEDIKAKIDRIDKKILHSINSSD